MNYKLLPEYQAASRNMKIKINSMDTKANPSDDEIRSYMDFDKLIEEAGKKSGKTGMNKWWLALLPGLAALWVVIYLNLKSGDETQHGTPEDQKKTAQDAGIHKDSKEQTARENRTENPIEGSAVNDASGPSSQSRPASPATTADKKIAARDPQKASSASSPATAPDVTDVYVQAEPGEGYAHLYAYFKENLKYPVQAIRDSVEGIETVSFTIDERGKPVRINITHSLGEPFDEEAVRLIQNMPDWKPATLNGRPVASQLSVPLTFQLRRTK